MNKSLILAFAFIITATLVRGQITSGSMMAGGTIAFTSQASEAGSSYDQSDFTFAPSFGYFVSDGLAVGAGLSLGTSRTGTGAAKTTGSTISVGPFVRYYKQTSNENLAIFGQATISIGTGKYDPAFGNVSHSSSLGFSVSPGAAYFFNEHWAAELLVDGFSISSYDPNTDLKDDKVTNVRFILSSFSPSLGFRYHF